MLGVVLWASSLCLAVLVGLALKLTGCVAAGFGRDSNGFGLIRSPGKGAVLETSLKSRGCVVLESVEAVPVLPPAVE